MYLASCLVLFDTKTKLTFTESVWQKYTTAECNVTVDVFHSSILTELFPVTYNDNPPQSVTDWQHDHLSNFLLM